MKVRLILPAVALGATLLLAAGSAEAGLFGAGCGVADCCAPAASCCASSGCDSCGCGHGHGLFHRMKHGLRNLGGCGCAAPAGCCDVIEPACGLPAPTCGVAAPVCGVAEVGCGCAPACAPSSCCSPRPFAGLGHKLRHLGHRFKRGCGASACCDVIEPTCGAAVSCCGM